MVAGQTLTHRAASDILALGSAATDSLHTGVGPATGATVWTADVSSETFTQRSLATTGTLGVRATGVTLARVQSERKMVVVRRRLVLVVIIFLPAAHVGVSDMRGGTFTHSSSSVVLTEGSLTTGVAGAGVKVTVGVGVSGVVWSTLADGVTTGGDIALNIKNISSDSNLPEAVQSALTPQGLVEQGSSLHSENGSPR